MMKFKSMFLMFMALTMFTTTTSLPEGGVVNVDSSHEAVMEGFSVLDANSTRQAKSKHKLMEPVVKLIFIGPQGPITTATGFSVEYDKSTDTSYILTNDHFCDAEQEFKGFFTFEKSSKMLTEDVNPYEMVTQRLEIVKTDPSVDLCLLSTPNKIKPVTLENRDYVPKAMDVVTTVGAPRGIFPIAVDSYFTGLIDRKILEPEMHEGEPFLLISQITMGGQSGSPVYNSKGKVVGVIFIQFVNTYGGGAIPLSDVHDFLENAK
jgi:S1-C subfamily serine protease